MKSTAKAPANIAFIKYWGKLDEKLKLPLNSSISMNLSEAYTITTVEFSEKYTEDEIEFLLLSHFGEERSDDSRIAPIPKLLRSWDSGRTSFARMTDVEKERVIRHLDLIRQKTRSNLFAKVATYNSFPKASGIASSASGFAALTLAAYVALTPPNPLLPRGGRGSWTEKELTIFARLGSGSAARSIPDGFVEWVHGKTTEESFASSLYPHTYWDLRDIVCVIESNMKETSSSGGMKAVSTSPLLPSRLQNVEKRLRDIKTALKTKNFRAFGEIVEADCLEMYQVMQTQIPPLSYWNDATLMLIAEIKHWRESGVPVYFTIDAGPNVHLICEGKDEDAILQKLKAITNILQIIINKPAPGAHVIKEHLF